jgi:hypothetical protein
MAVAAKALTLGRRSAWKDLVDDFVLFRTAHDFHFGHIEAAEEAVAWCAQRKLYVPAWARDAVAAIRAGEIRPNRRGRRPRLPTDFLEVLGVRLAKR